MFFEDVHTLFYMMYLDVTLLYLTYSMVNAYKVYSAVSYRNMRKGKTHLHTVHAIYDINSYACKAT